jgi:hypothetical protein
MGLFLKLGLRDYINHLHDIRRMNTTLSWIERSINDFLANLVKDIEPLGLVGLHKSKQCLTINKNIDFYVSEQYQEYKTVDDRSVVE